MAGVLHSIHSRPAAHDTSVTDLGWGEHLRKGSVREAGSGGCSRAGEPVQVPSFENNGQVKQDGNS